MLKLSEVHCLACKLYTLSETGSPACGRCKSPDVELLHHYDHLLCAAIAAKRETR